MPPDNSPAPAGLPSRRTSFIGRDAELAEIRGLLASDAGPRLLTLLGPGGCGKTRLAIQAAAQPARAPEGAWWVDLAGLADPALTPQTIAASLGLRETPPRPLPETIAAFIGQRRALIILDNCEHLIAACAGLAAGLLAACPNLRLLATSRQPLNLPDELAWPVPPMSLPDENGQPPVPHTLAAFDAIRLFVERAQHDLPDFELSQDNAGDVAQVCRQLHGLPLAIELAAARVPTLRVAQIAARLGDQLRLLNAGSAVSPPRHQTLRATLDWSHQLLNPAEQALFRRLAVFASGFTLEAAEAVAAGGDAGPPAGALDLLTQLVRKSLVVVEREPGREARFRLLDSLRQYAAERLDEAGERALAAGRHMDYYLQLAEAPKAHLGFFLTDADTAAWLPRLLAELDNLRDALEWSAQDPARAQAGLRAASALHWFWVARGAFSEARDWLARLLDADAGAGVVSSAVRAQAFTAAGWLTCWQGEFAAARSSLESGLKLSRELDDRWGIAFCLHGLGWAAAGLGQGARSRELLEESLSITRRLGDLWLAGFCHHFLGVGAALHGDFGAARAHFDEGIRQTRQTEGSATGLAFSHFHLSRMDRLEGQHASAAANAEQALRVFQAIGDPRGVAYVLSGLAALRMAQGQAAQAARLFGTVAALRATLGQFLEAPLQIEYEGNLAAARAALPKEEFDAAWAAGQAQSERIFDPAFEPFAPAGAPAFAQADFPPPMPAEPARAHTLRLLALGPAQVYRGDTLLRPADWTFARPKQLLFYLLSHPGRTREQIGLAFWPDASPEQLRSGLRSALFRMRRALGSPEWILFQDERYAFNRALSYWYDAEAFEIAVADAGRLAAAQPEQAIERLRAAAALVRGDYLEDFPAADWLDVRRESLRQQHLKALLSLGRLLLAANRHAQAADAYRDIIARDAYFESAHRGLMRSLARQGEPGQALLHYQGLYSLLQDELGAPPSPETAALHEQLKRGEPI